MSAGWDNPLKLEPSDAANFRLYLNVAEPDRLEVCAKLYTEAAETRDDSFIDRQAVRHVFRIMLDSDIALGSVPTFADQILNQIGVDTYRLLDNLMATA